ncbi:hypothetical protein CKO25_05075 [Thiocapsa imhoffii]|uniref:Uncharacterized protein n=1 Tax=Thiocapsa imhoffii TaxID=382777 RepID=A0A9X0WG53_9GAMM|nr:hypothetical protein [Thiocapsa imhoffii]MBK1644037.1 hypothetical protein [Thiocapsa imhoffii]
MDRPDNEKLEGRRVQVRAFCSPEGAERRIRGSTGRARPPEPTARRVPGGGYRLPFAFSTNGRPYLRQLATRSGIWFCDLRRPDNLGHPLDGWYTPDGLIALLKRDEERANAELQAQPFLYGFSLYPFQIAAIQIFDAVRIYEALKDITAMQPMVVDPNISVTQLVRELATVRDDTQRALVRDERRQGSLEPGRPFALYNHHGRPAAR